VKLEGSLDAFSLPDVFQLLSLTKKSGGLHLTNGQASGVVFFADGSVTGAISDTSRQALARRLVGLGAADDAALRRAVERGASEGAGVARALLEAGGVDSGLVQRLALEQAVDAVFDLLRWPNGDFAFQMGEENPDDVGLAVSAEKVVADATARRDSWESLSRLIPSPEVVLTMPVVQPEGAGSIASDEWALLSLIDGERTVGVLVDVSGAGQFTVVSTLASLVQRGLLVLRDEDGPDHVTLVRRRQQLLAPLEGGTAAAVDEPPTPTQGNPAQEPIVPGANVPATAGGPTTPQSPGGGAPTPPAGPVTPAEPTYENPAAAAAHAEPGVLPGAHDPASVVPPRPEPFMPKRVVDHPEPGRAPGFAAPATAGANAGAPGATAQGSGGPSASPGANASPSASAPQMSGAASGTAGVATAAAPASEAAIERDPTVNRSLMLRLIAGVRGL
jgi:hypothetical protein